MESGGDEDGVSPVKRGRGRPKGSTKKKSSPVKPKAKAATGKRKGFADRQKKTIKQCFVFVVLLFTGRRGRPKKDDKKEDSSKEDGEEEENEGGEEEEEEEDD